MTRFFHAAGVTDPMSWFGAVGPAERLRVLRHIIRELEKALAKATASGLMDLAAHLRAALTEAERELSSLDRLQRAAPAAIRPRLRRARVERQRRSPAPRSH